MKNNSNLVRRLVLTGVMAGVYTVMTMPLFIFAFGPVQFRISEILNLLAFINPVFAPGIILGVFLSNFFGSPIPFDWLFGTLSTVLALFFITRSKSLRVASIWPVIFSGVFVGAMLAFLTDFGMPFNLTADHGIIRFGAFTLSVMIGQFIVVTVVGVQLFKYLMKNERLVKFLKDF